MVKIRRIYLNNCNKVGKRQLNLNFGLDFHEYNLKWLFFGSFVTSHDRISAKIPAIGVRAITQSIQDNEKYINLYSD